nr:phage tail protein [Ruminococcus bromii]
MADNFGLKLGIEGEKEFKKSLAEINQTFKVLGSEMKLVSSQFDKNDNSVQALSARNTVLNKEIDAQKQKIETLRQALANASESFGETDRRTQSWQIQLNNAEASLNGMERELNSNNSALEQAKTDIEGTEKSLEKVDGRLDDTAESADDMGDEIKDAGDKADKSKERFSKLGSVLKGVGVAMGAVVTAAAATAVKLGKEVVNAYADYEQLVGGVDTLFKGSSQKLQSYASNAYKTAGLSANDYMETVTGFSASLIQSLGGDTDKSVKYADMAITDMADNANKMGTDMSLIQNAYQGFAKQNYTMLDNLKLGYGGTKEEMQRLLSDAEKISGVKYDISSYADVVDAIHVMQESMDIAGTTAKEAEGTISGSVNALKSSVTNLVVGFGDANADLDVLCENVVTAFQTVLENISPIVENLISALPTVITTLLESAGEMLPTVLETLAELFAQVLEGLLQLLPQLIPVAVSALLTITNAIVENLPLLIESATLLVATLVQGLADALPTLIPTAVNAVMTIVQGLLDSLPSILDAGLELVSALAQGILDALPNLISKLPQIIMGIVTFLLNSIPQIIQTGIKLLTSLVSALPDIITSIVKAIPQIIQAGIDLLISLVKALPTIIVTIVNAIPDIISGIVNALSDNIPAIIQAGIDLLISLVKNLPTIIKGIVKAVPKIIEGIVKAFGSLMYKIVEIGGNIVKGLWDGICGLASWLWDSVSGWISGIWDGICDFFGIHSPSKEMAWVGEMLVKGLAGSIDKNGDMAVRAAEGMSSDVSSVMNSLADDMKTALPTDFSIDGNVKNSVNTQGLNSGVGGLSLVLNIANFNNYSNDDISQLTNEIMETAGQFAKRKGLVFA